MRIPISIKIILVTVLMLIVAIFFVTSKSSEIMMKSIVEREDWGNLTEGALIAKQVESTFDNLLEHSVALSSLLLSKPPEAQIRSAVEKSKNLVFVEIYKVTEVKTELILRQMNESTLVRLSWKSENLIALRKDIQFPLDNISHKKNEIGFVSGKSPQANLLLIQSPLAHDAQNKTLYYMVVGYDFDILQSQFGGQSSREFYLCNGRGQLLAYQGSRKISILDDLKDYPIVKRAIKDQALIKQISFQDPQSHRDFIGAYSKIPNWDMVTYAQTAMDIIMEPALLVQREAIYASIKILAIAVFVCFLFSLSLTRPLETLAGLIREVKRGNFNVQARKLVRTDDEVGDLAMAFDSMTTGLRERDKMKLVLNKFHGRSVAENLVKGELAVGGTRKNITVFFSDIRGFTKFSEGHTPEEVVAMLNEYFDVMVKVIYEHGGVVDKFIGDAIMAVWGIEKVSPEDPIQAVSACLKMRMALSLLNEKHLKNGQHPIMIGMGLHFGSAISGIIGSDQRMEVTVIGDTVNTSSRIEASTKVYGTDLLVSSDIFEKIHGKFATELAGSVEVKGKSEALKLYKVLGTKDAKGAVQLMQTPYSSYEAAEDAKVHKS